MESVNRTITDKEMKQQITPLLEAILKSQPQTVIKTYSKTVIQITMPKIRYEKNGETTSRSDFTNRYIIIYLKKLKNIFINIKNKL